MKTLLKVLLVGFLLLIGGILILRYLLFPIVPVQHLHAQVPATAEQVLMLDTRALVSMSIDEMLGHPADGLPFEDNEEEDNEDGTYSLKKILAKGLWHGLELPEQLIVYRDKASTGRYTALLPLDDGQEFTDFLREEQARIQAVEQPHDGVVGEWPRVWQDSSYVIEVAQDHLRVIFGSSSILHRPSMPTDSWSAPEVDGRSESFGRVHLSSHGRATATIDLSSVAGRLMVDLQSTSTLPIAPLHHYGTEGAWLSLQVGPDAQRRKEALNDGRLADFLYSFGLSGAAVDTLWDGTVDLQLAGLMPMRREIVTYSYDDDFNKVETIEVRQQLEADFVARFGLLAPTDSLFYRQGWVKSVEGRDVFVNYPFQEVYYVERAHDLLLSSTGHWQRSQSLVDSAEGIFCHLDMARLTLDHERYTDSLKMDTGLRTIIGRIDTAASQLHVDIDFIDEERQGIFSLLDFLQSLRQPTAD